MRLDRDLVDGVADLDWIAPAWEALDRGEQLPQPFTDMMAMWRLITGEDMHLHARVTLRPFYAPDLGPAGLPIDIHPVSAALPALISAALPDPLQAALEALRAAATASGADAPVFLAEVRRAFPGIDSKQW